MSDTIRRNERNFLREADLALNITQKCTMKPHTIAENRRRNVRIQLRKKDEEMSELNSDANKEKVMSDGIRRKERRKTG